MILLLGENSLNYREHDRDDEWIHTSKLHKEPSARSVNVIEEILMCSPLTQITQI